MLPTTYYSQSTHAINIGTATISNSVNGNPNPIAAGYKGIKYTNLVHYSVQVIWRNATPGTLSTFQVTLPYSAANNYNNKYSAISEVTGCGTYTALDGSTNATSPLAPVIVETVNGTKNTCLFTFVPGAATGEIVATIYQNL